MNHKERYAAACQDAFRNFHPDFSGCKNLPEANKIFQLAASGLLSKEIAQHIGKTPKAVQKFFRRYNFPCLQNICPPLREERHGWKGGLKEVKGYVYSRTPGHPLGSKYGSYVAVHRLVVEAYLGRYLLPTEVVDHIDGNTKNNSPDNLRVFQCNADHLRETLKGRVPKWSDEGKSRLDDSRRRIRHPKRDLDTQPNPSPSESGADPLHG